MSKHSGSCTFEQARRGDHEVCSVTGCRERFPCAGNDCGHLDCIERRGKLPKCHFCGQQVSGCRSTEWSTGAVHGKTRAYHYDCRDQHASPNDRARRGDI